MTFSLRVTASDPAARVWSGRRHFTIGRPIEFDEASPHAGAVEYALGAVGGELVNGLREFARRRRMTIDAVEAVVSGELANGLTYLEVIGEQGEPALTRVAIKVFVSTPDPDGTSAMFGEMIERLPLVCTLRKATELQIELAFT